MANNQTSELIEAMFQVFHSLKKELVCSGELGYLTIMQIRTLILLDQQSNLSMSDLASHFQIELPSATSLVNKLVEQKLLERNEDPADRRLVIISLTKEGKNLAKQVKNDRRKKLAELLSHLSEKEKSQLLSILKNLGQNLHK
jgi:DNA-binding MarR family transcriptional regulator